MENLEEDNVKKQKVDPENNLLHIWRGDYLKLNHSQYKRNYIVLEDYVIYMDKIYHGEPDEKDEIAFMMMDVKGQGQIYLEDYRAFWIKFLEMYGELLQAKFTYDDESEEVTKMCFAKIASACNED